MVKSIALGSLCVVGRGGGNVQKVEYKGPIVLLRRHRRIDWKVGGIRQDIKKLTLR